MEDITVQISVRDPERKRFLKKWLEDRVWKVEIRNKSKKIWKDPESRAVYLGQQEDLGRYYMKHEPIEGEDKHKYYFAVRG